MTGTLAGDPHRRRPGATASGRRGRRQDRLFALLFGVAALVAGPARAEPLTAGLPDAVLSALQAAQIPTSALSLYVRAIDNPQPLIAHRSTQARNPASVIKLITTLAGLEQLGRDYRWHTEVYARGTLQAGRLQGDLLLRGEGDPYLTTERFWALLYDLRARGVQEIEGDLLLDASRIAPPQQHRADFDGRPLRPYNALPHALTLNFQATRVTLTPVPGAERPAVYGYPPAPRLQLDNGVTQTRAACRGAAARPRLQPESPMRLQLSGRLAESCDDIERYLLLMPPEQHLAEAFRALWGQLGGDLRGEVRSASRQAGDHRLLRQPSPPLAEVIRAINKHSNNLMSRLLFLTLGDADAPRTARESAAARPSDTSGSGWTDTPARDLPAARAAVAAWLSRKGLTHEGFHIDNGAGLSRVARLRADLLGELLVQAYQGPNMPEFLASLAVLGVDGTLHDRLQDSPLRGRAHLKTGSLNDTSALAGYLLDQQGRRWVLVMFLEHPGVQRRDEPVQDALLQWLYHYGAVASTVARVGAG